MSPGLPVAHPTYLDYPLLVVHKECVMKIQMPKGLPRSRKEAKDAVAVLGFATKVYGLAVSHHFMSDRVKKAHVQDLREEWGKVLDRFNPEDQEER